MKRADYLKTLTLEELYISVLNEGTFYCDFALEICRRAGDTYEEYWLEMPEMDDEGDMRQLVMEAYHIVKARG